MVHFQFRNVSSLLPAIKCHKCAAICSEYDEKKGKMMLSCLGQVFLYFISIYIVQHWTQLHIFVLGQWLFHGHIMAPIYHCNTQSSHNYIKVKGSIFIWTIVIMESSCIRTCKGEGIVLNIEQMEEPNWKPETQRVVVWVPQLTFQLDDVMVMIWKILGKLATSRRYFVTRQRL